MLDKSGMNFAVSDSIWSSVQKIWASSWTKPRTRISPCIEPELS